MPAFDTCIARIDPEDGERYRYLPLTSAFVLHSRVADVSNCGFDSTVPAKQFLDLLEYPAAIFVGLEDEIGRVSQLEHVVSN